MAVARYERVSIKVGTIPMLAYLRSRKPFEVGDKIQFRKDHGYKWQTGTVTNLNPLRVDL